MKIDISRLRCVKLRQAMGELVNELDLGMVRAFQPLFAANHPAADLSSDQIIETFKIATGVNDREYDTRSSGRKFQASSFASVPVSQRSVDLHNEGVVDEKHHIFRPLSPLKFTELDMVFVTDRGSYAVPHGIVE